MLGPLYYVYMGLLSVFCTNSINIYAGLNGLEVGQSLIIAAAMVVHNLIEISYGNQQHQYSFLFMLPYIGNTFALFKFNMYPSQVSSKPIYRSLSAIFSAIGVESLLQSAEFWGISLKLFYYSSFLKLLTLSIVYHNCLELFTALGTDYPSNHFN